MILIWLKIFLALLLIWPRGYLLIYLIDRTKSFNFGFKFFAGWLLGLAGFTLDIFAALTFGKQSLTPVVLLGSAISQIIGFSFMIFLFERKLILPKFKKFSFFIKDKFTTLKSFSVLEKVVLTLLVLTILVRIFSSAWQVVNVPTYDFDAWNNWNLRAKVIYTDNKISLDSANSFYLGGGIKSYPLNDALVKVWFAKVVGEFSDRVINNASLVYYLLLLAIFFFTLPTEMARLTRLLAVYLLSSVPFLAFHSHVPYADLYYSIFLFLSIAALFNFLLGKGLSFFYFSGIAGAFGVWTKNEGLSILLPLLIIISLWLVFTKRIVVKDFLLHWFFAALTIIPWVAFRLIYRLDVLSGDSSSFKLVFNSQFLGETLSSIFLRSHFNLLFILFFAVLFFKFKNIYHHLPTRFLFGIIAILFLVNNFIIIFTDKAYDLSAVVRVNMQLVPLVVFALVFFYHQFFGRIKS